MMQMKRVGFLAQVVPVGMGLIGVMTGSVHASEVPASIESAVAGELTPAGTIVQSSSALGPISAVSENQGFVDNSHPLQPWTGEAARVNWMVESSEVWQHSAIERTQTGLMVTSFTPLPALENAQPNESETTGLITTITAQEYSENFILADRSPQSTLTSPIGAEALVPDSQPIAQSIAQSIAQAEVSPETDAETDPETDPETDTEVEATSTPRWQISFIPYGFVPLSVDGSATVKDFTADVNLGLDDILDPLNFAAAGRVEAWRGNLGLIFDGSYFSISQDNSTSTSVPNCLCNIFPSKIDTEVNVQYGQFDLGVGYRTAENLVDAETEFDLGPLVFDAIAGMRIYALHQEINLSTDLGTERERSDGNTLITPLISGRLRWNLSPTVAGWVRGDIAGFGIGGTLMAASVTGGMEWMFSGNTSLLLAYRLSSLQYSTDVRGEDLELDLLMQGPYMGVVFRF